MTVDLEAVEVAHRLAVLAVEHGLAEMHPAVHRLAHAIAGGRSTVPEHADLFDRFWAKYPRKVGKPTARRAWTVLMRRGADIEAIRAGLARWMTYWREAGTQSQFIPHPHTWLSGERFNDDPPPLPSPVLPPTNLAPGDGSSTTTRR